MRDVGGGRALAAPATPAWRFRAHTWPSQSLPPRTPLSNNPTVNQLSRLCTRLFHLSCWPAAMAQGPLGGRPALPLPLALLLALCGGCTGAAVAGVIIPAPSSEQVALAAAPAPDAAPAPLLSVPDLEEQLGVRLELRSSAGNALELLSALNRTAGSSASELIILSGNTGAAAWMIAGAAAPIAAPAAAPAPQRVLPLPTEPSNPSASSSQTTSASARKTCRPLRPGCPSTAATARSCWRAAARAPCWTLAAL